MNLTHTLVRAACMMVAILVMPPLGRLIARRLGGSARTTQFWGLTAPLLIAIAVPDVVSIVLGWQPGRSLTDELWVYVVLAGLAWFLVPVVMPLREAPSSLPATWPSDAQARSTAREIRTD